MLIEAASKKYRQTFAPLNIKRLDFNRLKESLKCLTTHELPQEPVKHRPVGISDFIEEGNHTKRKIILEKLMRNKEKEVMGYILSDPKKNPKEQNAPSIKDKYELLERKHKSKSMRSHRLILDIKSYLQYAKKLSHRLEEKNEEVDQALKNLHSFPNSEDLQLAKRRKKHLSHLESLKNGSIHKSNTDLGETVGLRKTHTKVSNKALKLAYFKRNVVKMIYKKRIHRFLTKVCIIEIYYKTCMLRQFNEALITSLKLSSEHKGILKTVAQLDPLKELEQQYALLQKTNFGVSELYGFNKKFRFIRFYIETAYLILFRAHDKTSLLNKARMVYRQINFKILTHLSNDELRRRFCQTIFDLNFTQKQHILHEKMIRRSIIEEFFKKVSKSFERNVHVFHKKLGEFATKNRYFLKKLAEASGVNLSEFQRGSSTFLAKRLYLHYTSHKDFPTKPVFSILMSQELAY